MWKPRNELPWAAAPCLVTHSGMSCNCSSSRNENQSTEESISLWELLPQGSEPDPTGSHSWGVLHAEKLAENPRGAQASNTQNTRALPGAVSIPTPLSKSTTSPFLFCCCFIFTGPTCLLNDQFQGSAFSQAVLSCRLRAPLHHRHRNSRAGAEMQILFFFLCQPPKWAEPAGQEQPPAQNCPLTLVSHPLFKPFWCC